MGKTTSVWNKSFRVSLSFILFRLLYCIPIIVGRNKWTAASLQPLLEERILFLVSNSCRYLPENLHEFTRKIIVHHACEIHFIREWYDVPFVEGEKVNQSFIRRNKHSQTIANQLTKNCMLLYIYILYFFGALHSIQFFTQKNEFFYYY